MIGAKVKPKFEEEAKARMLAGKKTDPKVNLPEGGRHQARDDAAKAVNVSPRTVEFASKVLEKGAPQ